MTPRLAITPDPDCGLSEARTPVLKNDSDCERRHFGDDVNDSRLDSSNLLSNMDNVDSRRTMFSNSDNNGSNNSNSVVTNSLYICGEV